MFSLLWRCHFHVGCWKKTHGSWVLFNKGRAWSHAGWMAFLPWPISERASLFFLLIDALRHASLPSLHFPHRNCFHKCQVLLRWQSGGLEATPRQRNRFSERLFQPSVRLISVFFFSSESSLPISTSRLSILTHVHGWKSSEMIDLALFIDTTCVAAPHLCSFPLAHGWHHLWGSKIFWLARLL